MFADVDFYKNEYLPGMHEIIPHDEFNYYSRKASERINRRKVELDDIPEYLSMATCEVAEMYYKANQANSLTAKKSESVGGYSVTYVEQDDKKSELEKSINEIIIRWLAFTPLHDTFIFKGV